MGRILVIGLGVTGVAVAHAYPAGDVVVVDDGLGAGGVAGVRERAAAAGVPDESVVVAPSADRLRALVSGAELVVPSPGVPPRHPVYRLAAEAGVPLVSEVELAWRRAHERGIPVVAITGTNGKTTVTTLVAAMLHEAGKRAVAAGNIGLPLIDAAQGDHDVLVAEVSSFQLQFTERFQPAVSVWLNLAEDHLDWHPTLDEYAAAKARIWANQSRDAGDTAIANADDAAVMALAPAWATTFSIVTGAKDGYRVEKGCLVDPGGETILAVDELPRALPHDIANSLAAAAAAVGAGAPADVCGRVLAGFPGLPHRVEHIGDRDGVGWYDDSKATTPASVVAALAGFESAVLIAGGKNKGLDLGVIAGQAPRIRSVVAIGDAAGEVVAALGSVRTVTVAESMQEAVEQAAAAARPGDAVLLSPGCASFDWYRSYGERGDDFTRRARALGVRRAGEPT